jgi:hypothetical protein
MPITNNNPIVLEASSQKVFDTFWIKRINISTPSPTKPSFAEIVYSPIASDGTMLDSDLRRLNVPNVLQKAATDIKLQAAMTALIEAVDSLINEQG